MIWIICIDIIRADSFPYGLDLQNKCKRLEMEQAGAELSPSPGSAILANFNYIKTKIPTQHWTYIIIWICVDGLNLEI